MCTCKSARLPLDVFSSLHHLPDPVKQEDGHHKPFSEVFGTATTEEACPSLAKKHQRKQIFTLSIQHARNTDRMLQCDECEVETGVFKKEALSLSDRNQFDVVFNDMSFSCGAQLADLELPPSLQNVFVRDLTCSNPTEKLYYSLGHENIHVCYYCGQEVKSESVTDDLYYPRCNSCNAHAKVRRHGK